MIPFRRPKIPPVARRELRTFKLPSQFLMVALVVVIGNVVVLRSMIYLKGYQEERLISISLGNAYMQDKSALRFINHSEVSTSIGGTTISSETSKPTFLHPTNSNQTYSVLNPYYRYGKTRYKQMRFHRKTTFETIASEVAKPIRNSSKERIWVLPHRIQTPTRNHESILLEYGQDNNQQVLINVLGRYSRVVQWMDLVTGQQFQVETLGTDPDHRPLNDLNHVASVLVDNINDPDKKEIWLPCGFHNDRIGKEQSSNYVRIVDLHTMEVRHGPKMPYSGGACGAAPISALHGDPPLICAFGGTDGNHDTGELV
jgi:hypothetical protein